MAVSRGYAAEGDPEIWEIHDERLYFFFSQSNRQMFRMDLADAEAAWPKLFTW